MKISVGILTKNRDTLLENLLQTINANTIKPDEIIIVDNGSENYSKKIICKYKKILPIKYFKKSINIPASRNFILKTASFELLSFIDDDCRADKNWIKNTIRAHRDNPKAIAIQGKSTSISKNALIEKAMNDEYKLWIDKNIIESKYLRILDTKNLSLKIQQIRKKKIFFNEKLIRGSDIDFGDRIFNKKYMIIYEKSIQVFHQERNLLSLIKQWFVKGRTKYQLNKMKKQKQKVKIRLNNMSILSIFLRLIFFTGYTYQRIFIKNK